MTNRNFEIKGIEYYIKKCDIEDEDDFYRTSENYIKEIDILKIKMEDKIKLKVSYFNKCVGTKKGFHVTEYNEDDKVRSEYVFDLYINNDDKIKIIIQNRTDTTFVMGPLLRIIGSSESSIFELHSDIDFENSTIKFGDDVSDEKNKVILNINEEEYESEIKYVYKRNMNDIFEDEEIESYYNYCCNEQGD
jgi:hypothetical protein